MTTTTLPEPTVTTRGRTITVDYPVGEPYVDTHGDNARKVVSLSVGHDSGRKQFYAVAYEVVVSTTPTASVRAYEPFNGVHVRRDRVARYSAKALAEFAEQAQDALADVVAINPTVEAWFAV